MSSNNNEVRHRCKNCKRIYGLDEKPPCPNCRSIEREIIWQTTETLNIAEKTTAEVATLKRNYPWFIATVIVTMSAPFITAIPGLTRFLVSS